MLIVSLFCVLIKLQKSTYKTIKHIYVYIYLKKILKIVLMKKDLIHVI